MEFKNGERVGFSGLVVGAQGQFVTVQLKSGAAVRLLASDVYSVGTPAPEHKKPGGKAKDLNG